MSKSSGFNRLKGLAAASVAMSASLFGAVGSARAATRTFEFTVNFTGVGADNRSFEITGISNSTTEAITASFTYVGDYTTEVSSSQSGFMISELSALTNNTGAGSLGDSHDGMFSYAVGGTLYSNPDNTVDLTDNILTTEVMTDIQAGVNASIQIRFYSDKSAIRGILVLSNTTAAEIKVPVAAIGDMGSDSDTIIQATSSGDTTLDSSDLWVSSNDGSTVGNGPSSDPVVVWAIQGEDSILADAQELIGFNTPGTGSYTYQYDVTIPANSTVRIMNLAYFAFTNAEAETAAADLENIDKLKAAGYLDDLTNEELSEIANFTDVIVDTPIDTPAGTPTVVFATDTDQGGNGSTGMAMLSALLSLMMLRRRARK